jgi:hypothetical protein
MTAAIASIWIGPLAAAAFASHQLHASAGEILTVVEASRFRACAGQQRLVLIFANARNRGIRYAWERTNRTSPSSALSASLDPPQWHPLPGDGAVRIGLPHGRTVRDPRSPDRFEAQLDDGVLPNPSNAVAFDSLGHAASGVLFLTDNRKVVAVVMDDATGRAGVEDYDFESEVWRAVTR